MHRNLLRNFMTLDLDFEKDRKKKSGKTFSISVDLIKRHYLLLTETREFMQLFFASVSIWRLFQARSSLTFRQIFLLVAVFTFFAQFSFKSQHIYHEEFQINYVFHLAALLRRAAYMRESATSLESHIYTINL